jgi:hypothetical protein
MNDFLHSLRNNNQNHNQKRYDRPRRHYDNQQYGNNDRKNSNYRNHHRNNADTETLNAIRKTLESIAEGHRTMVDLGERRARAEERKAEAIERIAEHVVSWLSQSPPVAVAQPQEARRTPRAENAVAMPLDPKRQELVDKVKGLRAQGLSYEKIAQQLENEEVPTLSGRGRWRGQTIHRLCNGTAFGNQGR